MRAQLLDGSARDGARHGPPHRVPADRPDRDRRDAAAARALEPARRVRHREARPAALGGAEAVRVERVHLADRDAAAAPGAHAQPEAARSERRDVARRRTRASAATCCASSTERGPLLSREIDDHQGSRRETEPLVRRPPDRAHARGPAPLRRGRDRRPPQRPARLGSRRALVSRRPSASRCARPSARSTSSASARSASGSCKGEWHAHPDADDGPGARPGHVALAVRPADPRPRRGRSALGLPLPARDVRPAGEARVRLLRAPRARRRPDRRPRRAAVRPQDAACSRCSAPGATPRGSTRRSRASRSISARRRSLGQSSAPRNVRTRLLKALAELGDERSVRNERSWTGASRNSSEDRDVGSRPRISAGDVSCSANSSASEGSSCDSRRWCPLRSVRDLVGANLQRDRGHAARCHRGSRERLERLTRRIGDVPVLDAADHVGARVAQLSVIPLIGVQLRLEVDLLRACGR